MALRSCPGCFLCLECLSLTSLLGMISLIFHSFLFSARKRLAQLWAPVEAGVPVAYTVGNILTPGFLCFFFPVFIFNPNF